MDNKRTIKVGIYGVGGHARNNHLLNLTRLEGVEVVAVCDIVEENARQAAADFGISRSYTDGHEMVKQESLDALFVFRGGVAHRRTAVSPTISCNET